MKTLRTLFIACSLLTFTGVMTSCEEEEIIITKTDGDNIAETPDVDD